MGEEALQVPPLPDQLQGGLLPHAGDARDVVRGIAQKRQVIRNRLGGKAVVPLEGGSIVLRQGRDALIGRIIVTPSPRTCWRSLSEDRITARRPAPTAVNARDAMTSSASTPSTERTRYPIF